jgi:hypothetical protein
MGAPVLLVLSANLSLETGVRPSWVVLVSTGAVALLGWVLSVLKARAKTPLKTA